MNKIRLGIGLWFVGLAAGCHHSPATPSADSGVAQPVRPGKGTAPSPASPDAIAGGTPAPAMTSPIDPTTQLAAVTVTPAPGGDHLAPTIQR